jgi:hypothetical protein
MIFEKDMDMATKDEHPERYGWWINELNSLGIEPKRINEMDDLQELCNITQRLKETFFQYYKSSYKTIHNENEEETHNYNYSRK